MATKKAAPKEPPVIDRLLDLEEPTIATAREWPAGDNSDAVKHALMGAASAISAVRNALDTNKRLERPA